MPRRAWKIDEHGRECRTCEIYKPWSEFGEGSICGKNSECKTCIHDRYVEKARRQGAKERTRYARDENGRECAKCGIYKPWSEFSIKRTSETGHASRCAACERKTIPRRMDENGRECLKCGTYKPWSEFRLDDRGYHGRCGTCIDCLRARGREYFRRKTGANARKVWRTDAEGRECSKCGTYKPWSEFTVFTQGPYQHGSRCAECRRADTQLKLEQYRHQHGIKSRKFKKDAHGRECSRCGVYKPWSEFNLNRGHVGGHNNACRACVTKKRIEEARSKGVKEQYWIDDDGRVCTGCGEYKPWSEFHRSRAHSHGRFPKCKCCYGLNLIMSHRIRKSLAGAKKGRHWEDLVGYTKGELEAWIASWFEPGMTWDNYGVWHIDHLIPIAYFKFDTVEDVEFHMCWRIDNLVPRWATDGLARRYNSITMGNMNKKDRLVVEPRFEGLLKSSYVPSSSGVGPRLEVRSKRWRLVSGHVKFWHIDENGRECSKCEVYKPWSEFTIANNNTTGHCACCRECYRRFTEIRQRQRGVKARRVYRIDESGRECSKCKVYKPWSDFNLSADSKHGHCNRCRKCVQAKQREYRIPNGGKVRLVPKMDEHGRECARCRIYKPWSEFGRSVSGVNGRNPRCLVCVRIARGKSAEVKRCKRDEHGRECSDCGVYKPWSEFGAKRGSYCSECRRKQWRKYAEGLGMEPRSFRKDSEGRVCVRCKVYKPWSDFYLLSRGAYGHSPSCKVCRSEEKKLEYENAKRLRLRLKFGDEERSGERIMASGGN